MGNILYPQTKSRGLPRRYRYASAVGTPIIAAAAGTVVAKYRGERSNRGIEIILRHSPKDTGLPFWTYTQYAHFDDMPAHEIGQRVRMGETLGLTGNSGASPK